MAISPDVLRALQASGATVDMIIAAVEADQKREAEVAVMKRAKAAERKRVYRADLRNGESSVPEICADLAGLDGTSQDIAGQAGLAPSPKERSPRPPKEITLSTGDRSARAASFARLRAAYPKRKGANPWQPAEEKFCRLIRDGIDPEAIIAGAEAYAESRRFEDPQFTKTTVAWLNAGMWKDEYEPSTPPGGGGPRAGPPDPSKFKNPYFASAARDALRRQQSDDQQSPRDNIVQHPNAPPPGRGKEAPVLDLRAEAPLFDGSIPVSRRFAE